MSDYTKCTRSREKMAGAREKRMNAEKILKTHHRETYYINENLGMNKEQFKLHLNKSL